MSFYADLHVHSRYARATSRNADLVELAWWARRKGITVLGTGDFTHPAWFGELEASLVPAEPGLFRLRDELEGAGNRRNVRRADYNEAVRDYHAARSRPRAAAAGERHGLAEEPYFASGPGRPAEPKVNAAPPRP